MHEECVTWAQGNGRLHGESIWQLRLSSMVDWLNKMQWKQGTGAVCTEGINKQRWRATDGRFITVARPFILRSGSLPPWRAPSIHGAGLWVFSLVAKMHTAPCSHIAAERCVRFHIAYSWHRERRQQNKNIITATIIIWPNIFGRTHERRSPFIVIQFFIGKKGPADAQKYVWLCGANRAYLIRHYSRIHKIITEMDCRLRDCVCVWSHMHSRWTAARLRQLKRMRLSSH